MDYAAVSTLKPSLRRTASMFSLVMGLAMTAEKSVPASETVASSSERAVTATTKGKKGGERERVSDSL